jgi:hypothetical protein
MIMSKNIVQIPTDNNQIIGFYNGNPIIFRNLESCSEESFYNKDNFYEKMKFNTYLNKNYIKQNNKVCPICLDSLNTIKKSNIIITNCNHIFCNNCIKKLNSNKCPMCNKENFNYKKFKKEIKPTIGIQITTIVMNDNIWYNKDDEIKITPSIAYNILYKYFIKKAWNTFKEMNIDKKRAFLYYNKKNLPQKLLKWNVDLWDYIIEKEYIN